MNHRFLTQKDIKIFSVIIVLIVVVFVIRASYVSNENVEMILVEGGKFLRGDDQGDEDIRPRHEVFLNDFYLSKYEITNAQYCVFLNEMGKHVDDKYEWIGLERKFSRIELENGEYRSVRGYERHPVLEVSWYGAVAYCEWKGGRLPTEAEWEYAASGGNKSQNYAFSGSDNPNFVAWYVTTSGADTRTVGTKQPNELGFYDMSGNAWEWCYDWYGKNYYKKYPFKNPKGPEDGSYKVIRGGSWCTFGTENLEVKSRVIALPEHMGTISFRLCFDIED